MKEINTTVQDLKVEIEARKKIQTEEILKMENLRKRTVTTGASITNRIQKMKERISGIGDVTQEIDQSKKMLNLKKFLKQNNQEIWDIVKRPNLRIIGRGEESRSKAQKIFSTKS